MIDYSKWKQTSKAATSLQLDHRNPRLSPRTSVPTQPELVAEMIAHEEIYTLAKSIVEKGVYPNDVPIAVEEGGRVVVVEGNRRLCAIKLLISPSLAPDGDRARFKKLSHKANLSTIRRMAVLIAPTRDAAAPLIESKHTRRDIEKWSPVMQARFYADRITEGESVDDLAAEFGTPAGEIRQFLQNYQMYCIACSVPVPLGIADKVKDPRGFPLSTLERIYRNTEAANFLGITFDPKTGDLKGSIPVDEFRKAFAKIVTDVAVGREVNSRQLNTTAEFKKYLGTFGAAAPDKSKKGSFTSKDLLGTAGKAHATPKGATLPSVRPVAPQRALISRLFICGIEDPRINGILKELKRIPVLKHENAVALTLRALVEIVFGDYCERLGITKVMVASFDKKGERPADWFPSSRQMLNYLLNNASTLDIHPLALKAAKLLVNDNSSVSVLLLDAFAHNKWVLPTEPEVRSFWAKIEEAMKFMLTPISKKPNA